MLPLAVVTEILHPLSASEPDAGNPDDQLDQSGAPHIAYHSTADRLAHLRGPNLQLEETTMPIRLMRADG